MEHVEETLQTVPYSAMCQELSSYELSQEGLPGQQQQVRGCIWLPEWPSMLSGLYSGSLGPGSGSGI